MKEDFESVVFKREEGVAKIILNRPPLNIMNIAMMKEINTILEKLQGDAESKVLVITGRGRAFSAGVDVAEHTVDKVEEMIGEFHRIFHLLGKLPIPTLAVINGMALGGGCELAIACDIIIASEDAKIGQPEIKVGVFPPVAAVLLPRLIGRPRAMELLLTGEHIGAKEAAEIGLINKAVPPDELEDATEDFIQKLNSLSGIVIRLTKKATYQGLGLRFEDALANAEEIYLNELMKTYDANEGLSAFLEKRKPVWKNR
jgi:cyclohexa-1,5-dienecarbonyl-CoA hydratase